MIAIGARDPERARTLADRLGVPESGDYETVLNHPDVDLVYLPLPSTVQAHWAVRALQAGKHVLCEKPLSANGTTAAEIAEAADAAGRRAFVGFHYRLHGFTRRLLEVLASDVLGRSGASSSTTASPTSSCSPATSASTATSAAGRSWTSGATPST